MIGGWTAPRGSRTDLGALLLGYYDDDRLRYAGKVGTGFTQATLRDLAARLAPLRRDRAPFADELRMSGRDVGRARARRPGRLLGVDPRRAAAPPALPRAARGQGREGGGAGVSPTVKAGRREVPVSSADRVVFDGAGLTKLDLARYYADVAGAMVPHVRDRPLALHTFPKGVGGDGYFAKNEPRHFPDWIATVDVAKREGGTIRAGARQRRGRRSCTWRGRTRSRCTSGRAGRTASSVRTASSSTSTRPCRTSRRCGRRPARRASCCATSASCRTR